MPMPRERPYGEPNIASITRKWNNRMKYDSEVLGALELAYLRGEQSGYLAGYADAKKRKRNKWGKHK